MRIISKNCRKCGSQFDQKVLQGSGRPTEYCGVRCKLDSRRARGTVAARVRYARTKAHGYKPEERVEELDFGA